MKVEIKNRNSNLFFFAGGHAVVPNEARDVCNVIPALKVFQQEFVAFHI